MKATVPKVLMVGTDPRGQGGIASVVAMLQQAGFLARNQVPYVATRLSKMLFHLHGAQFQQFAATGPLTRWSIGQPLASSSMIALSDNRSALWIAPQVSSSRGTPALEGALKDLETF